MGSYGPAVIQNAAAAIGNGTDIGVVNLGTVAMQVTGTFSATITWEGTIDGTNWVSVYAVKAGTGALATTATTTGIYYIRTAALKRVRARISGWVSGTVTVTATGSTEDLDMPTGPLAAGTAIIGQVGIDQTTPGTTNAITVKAVAGAAAAHRSAIVAADVLAVPGTVTCTKLTGVGSATAGTYTVFVVAGNTYGRTTAKQGDTTVTTETTNLGVRAAFAAVTGATFYDLYMSTDGAAAKFVGRVTEAQRGTGIIISAQNTTSAGGTAGAVDIYVAGTGLAVNAGQLTLNVAYVPEGITAIDPSGAQNLDIDVLFSRTGDSVASALTLIPFYEDTTGTYAAGDPITLTFGGGAGTYYPNRQTLRLPCRGRKTVVVVASIAGTGASVTINAVAS